MEPFRRTRSGYRAGLDAAERAVVARVAGEVLALLSSAGGQVPDAAAWPAPERPAPQDPVLARLLPEASRGVPEVAAEFRRLAQDEVVDAKVAGLRTLLGLLDGAGPDAGDPAPLVVARPQAAQVARALADVRLALGARLGLRDDEDTEALYEELENAFTGSGGGLDDDLAEPERERLFVAAVLELTGALQQSLVDAMLVDLRAGRG